MRLGLFGGAFNPVHLGHMRLAVELAEVLGLDRVELVPSAHHPLKRPAGMLPYALRLELLSAAAEALPLLAVSDVESRLPPPSYTWRTLEHTRAERPDAELFFLISVTDLLNLPKWQRARELPTLAHLAVGTRLGLGLAEVEDFVGRFWPEAVRAEAPDGALARWSWSGMPGSGLTLVDTTRMDLCATDIRRRFLAGHSIRWLMPAVAQDLLWSRRAEVEAAWRWADVDEVCPSG